MTKVTDQTIQDTIAIVDDKLKTLNVLYQEAKFLPKTNMNLEIFGKRYNLHTSDMNELRFLMTFLQVMGHQNDNLVLSNFEVSEWFNDITQRFHYLQITSEIEQLKSTRKKLQTMLSAEFQNQVLFDQILELLKND